MISNGSASAHARPQSTIYPDGRGLPLGAGDARKGAVLYRQHCQACHGAGGAGGVNDALVGGRGTLDTMRPIQTLGSYWPYATTVFDYIDRAMPYTAPGSLSSDEVYSLTAYLLSANGIIGEHFLVDAETLPRIRMPNRDGFRWRWGWRAEGIGLDSNDARAPASRTADEGRAE